MDILTQAVVDEALERISTYQGHDYCDMDLDASFTCERSALEIYTELLFKNSDALTPSGRDLVEGWVRQTIANADELATEHGLTSSKEA